MLEYCKLQIGCILVILYTMFIYYKELRRFRQKHKPSLFDGLLMLGLVCVLFDGLTAYTVNHLDVVDKLVNQVLHLFFLVSLDSFIFLLFLYMLSITAGFPKKQGITFLLNLPFIVNIIIVVVNIPNLQYHEGEISNYSMGMSAYTCFAMAAIYIVFSMVIFLKRWRYTEKHKRVSVFTYLLILVCVTGYQMFHPQALLSSICVTVIVLGVYMNQENPAVNELSIYHHEMIMGFATLVENKDGSTGGHVRRTTLYVKLLAEELRERGYYKDVLTKDYMKNLLRAAPMHDVGKIAVPDAILQAELKSSGKLLGIWNAKNIRKWRIRLHSATMKNGTEKDIRRGLNAKKFLCVQELWQLRMCLMQCPKKDVTGMQCLWNNVLKLFRKAVGRTLIPCW